MSTEAALDRRAAYVEAFARECGHAYPIVDAFERECGYAIDRTELQAAAWVLACPVKKNPPNWQHGRVLYAAARRYLATTPEVVSILDIGTAKGFSALCLEWALRHSGIAGKVTSVDVIDPDGTVCRNTVAELDGPVTLRDILAPWPAESAVAFEQSTGVDWLERHPERVHIVFVDGKHSGVVVRREGVLLAARQRSGDLAIFDDVHIPDVSVAVNSLMGDYRITYLEVLPQRHYAVGVRR